MRPRSCQLSSRRVSLQAVLESSKSSAELQRSSKAEVERNRRIEELRQESQTLAATNRRRRDRDEERHATQQEAAQGVAAGRSFLAEAKESATSAQVSSSRALCLRVIV